LAGFEEGGGVAADEGAGPIVKERAQDMRKVWDRSRHANLKMGGVTVWFCAEEYCIVDCFETNSNMNGNTHGIHEH
jgi:hypothetical protein